ncbi:MAG: TonB-dependent receptor [Myxococcaceae bacterium]|nr:TonB-dependent receptor [Myxococcaceae bacterium]
MTALLVALLLSQELPDGLVAPSADCPGPPDYPPNEKVTGIGGRVVLNVSIDETGAVTKLEVFQALAPAFDEAAIASAKKCTFKPATMNGKALPSVVQLSADFAPPLQPWTLEGDVVGELGEPLAGATVTFGGKTATTDAAGHFSLTYPELPPGDGWVQVALAGKGDKAFPEVFRSGLTTRVRYQLPNEKTYETRVEGSRLLPPIPEPDKTPQVSKFIVTKADLDRAVGAYEDVTRVVQQAPGVAADPDILGTLFVRGGGPDEVIFYLDGVPLSNPYHLGGYLSIFNPQMLETAEFYTGGIPARFEPTLSGALEIHYATGETKKPHLLADLSMQTAMLRADVPLGVEGLSAVVSFRRSYFEAYFAALRALKIVGSNFFAPEITEALARVSFRRGRHHTMATYMYVQDGINLSASPGETPFFNFAGDLRLANRMHLGSVQHTIDLGGDSNLKFQASFTHDRSSSSVREVLPGDTPSDRFFGQTAWRGDLTLRSDLVIAGPSNRIQAGVQFAHRELSLLSSAIADTRGNGAWAQYPSVSTYDQPIEPLPYVTRDLLSAYAEDTHKLTDNITLEAGGRGQLEVRTSQFSGSARVAGAVTLPIHSVIKVSAGVSLQPIQSPLLLDERYGNPALTPERSSQVVLGLEQPLPFEALVRLELWVKYLDNLVVNPDTYAGVLEREARGDRVFVNGGTGLARGGDLLFMGRTRHFFYGLSLGLLSSERTNPLATTGRNTYPVPWDQQFTSAFSLSWSPNDHWLFSGRFSLRSGRPYTPVTGFRLITDDEGKLRWVPDFAAINSERYPWFYELSLRGEYRWNFGPVKMAFYAEVMNVTNAMNAFTYIYGSGTTDPTAPGGVMQPERGQVNHLPIRPFIGVRAEY